MHHNIHQATTITATLTKATSPRRSSFSPLILRTLHTKTDKKVVVSEQNSQNAPHRGAATRPNRQDCGRFQREFSGRSTRQRSHPPNRSKQQEGRRSPRKFRARSCASVPAHQNHPNTTERSSFASRISKALQNTEIVRAKNFKDAPCASVTAGCEHRESRHSHREFQGPTRQRHDRPRTSRRSSFAPRISKTLHTPALPQGQNNERVVVAPRISRTLHAPARK